MELRRREAEHDNDASVVLMAGTTIIYDCSTLMSSFGNFLSKSHEVEGVASPCRTLLGRGQRLEVM